MLSEFSVSSDSPWWLARNDETGFSYAVVKDSGDRSDYRQTLPAARAIMNRAKATDDKQKDEQLALLSSWKTGKKASQPAHCIAHRNF